MLKGSFVVVGDTLKIETHVVEVASGIIETSYTTMGPAKQFLSLQTRMTEGVIARLDLPITDEERKMLVARQNTDVDALKLLIEVEGGGTPAEAPKPPGPGTSLLYFDNVKDLKIVISDVDAAVVGDEAVVSYTRTDDFADARTGRPMHVSVRLTKTLKRTPGGWKLAPGK